MKIGIISDLHEDIIRTREAIELLREHGCEFIVCLGDLVGVSMPYYGYLASRNGHEIIETVKKDCNIVIPGNHDLFCIKKTPESGTFDFPKNRYDLDFPTRSSLGSDKVRLYENGELASLLSEDDQSYIADLPEYVVKEIGDKNILFSHWIYPEFIGDSKSDVNYSARNDFMMEKKYDINFVGHAHNIKQTFSKMGPVDIGFNQKISIDSSEPIGCIVPPVCNSTFPNGVTIFDSDKMEVEFLPLNTPLHVVPGRAKS